MLPHVDDFRTVHNLDSLGDLASALSRPATRKVEHRAALSEARMA